ncbi:MFS transporter [Pseudonocardia acidicola]|uniref:MFS transporter n=1 Tax=Pseudonocardia acidicola TaxID=2724939 RepID=A0ABX1SET2_9PSEU|nr:MFS transporter [Pseudonocardia acidicola]NMI00077.1 MFS transporter [Pseudonocardia acidicola]
MYQIENSAQVLAARRGAPGSRPARPWVNRTVLALGLTSLFTDVSAEMITTVLPLYLVFGLQLSPLVFGVVDGLYTGATAPVRLLAGLWADRARRHKEAAVAGYALSTLSRLGMLAVGNVWTALAGLVFIDRVGKGIRTAPRDAMISLATPREQWAAAFGAHRALDMVGAMGGPVLAFAVLAAVPGGYDAVFVVSLCAGLIGLGVVALFVRNPPMPAAAGSGAGVSLRAAARLLRRPGVTGLVVAGSLLGLATLSDGFVYLTLQDRLGFDIGFFPLLYVATSLVFMVLAVPVGRLADRHGRPRVFTAGYGSLLLIYLLLLTPWAGVGWVVVCLVLLGGYYAATDGVLMALAGAVLPARLRTSGMALITTATSLARLVSSLLFGLLWTVAGTRLAVGVLVAFLVPALVVAVVVLGRGRREVTDGDAAG